MFPAICFHRCCRGSTGEIICGDEAVGLVASPNLMVGGSRMGKECHTGKNAMNDPLTPDARRRQYFEDYNDRVDRHRGGFAFYEQRAIEFA